VFLVLFLWMTVDVILAVTYLITRRRERPHESRPHRKTRGVVVQSDADSGPAVPPAPTRRSDSSTLRRTLAGLLLDAEGYRTRWTDRVVLVDEDELRLTEWMSAHLRVSWCRHPEPRAVEPDVVRALRPPLNIDHASGPLRDGVKAARQRYYDSTGPRP
jgi:hypothetical protein